MPTKMSNSDESTVVIFKGWDEPNNGRMLWKVDVFINNQLQNEIIFKNGWNYINEKIDRLQLEDDSSKFLFISSEGNGRLINKKNLHITELPYKGISTAKFISNHFSYNHLLISYSDSLSITSLKTLESAIYDKDFDGHIFSSELISETEVLVQYYNVIDRIRIENEVIIRLDDFLNKYT